MQRDPPRHIRDIAHLYLSRMDVPHGKALRLVVAGVSPDVVPGFHAANLALAAAGRGMTVRIVEASGLPVSAGCFLGLDPSCWALDGHAPEAAVSAFSRVSFARTTGCGWTTSAVAIGNGAAEAMEVVHAPPWDAGEEHVRGIADAIVGPTVLLYLAERDEPPRPWIEWGHAENVAARVAFVTRAGSSAADSASAGVITRWSAALTDPLPVVLRDPGSRLARQYRDVLSNLLAETGTASSDQPGSHHAIAPIKSV